MEQRVQGTLQIWAEPFVALRVPEALQPAHRPVRARRHHLEHVLRLADRQRLPRSWPASALVAQFLETFKEFPPRQKAASFTHRPGRREARGGAHHRAMTARAAGAPRWSGSPAATFRMGSDAHYPEEAPAHPVDGQRLLDRPDAVTNRDFAAFVADTGYVTVAERPLDPADFPARRPRTSCPARSCSPARPGRSTCATSRSGGRGRPARAGGAPRGRQSSSPAARTIRSCTSPTRTPSATRPGPGKALPTEAQWELAARGGLDGASFTWGDEPEPAGGRWPTTGTATSRGGRDPGYGTPPRPVGSFPPNGYGLFDMAGNVWEWTADWYAARHPEPADAPVLRAARPARRPRERESLDPRPAAVRRSRARSSRAARSCAPTATACATGPPRAARR